MRSHFGFDIYVLYFIYILTYTLFIFFVSFAPILFLALLFWSSFAYSSLVDCFLLREIIRINCSCLCKNKWSIPTNTYNSIKGWLEKNGNNSFCNSSKIVAKQGMKYPKFCIGFKIRKSRCKQILLLVRVTQNDFRVQHCKVWCGTG